MFWLQKLLLIRAQQIHLHHLDWSAAIMPILSSNFQAAASAAGNVIPNLLFFTAIPKTGTQTMEYMFKNLEIRNNYVFNKHYNLENRHYKLSMQVMFVLQFFSSCPIILGTQEINRCLQ